VPTSRISSDISGSFVWNVLPVAVAKVSSPTCS
jgi:hypothetical protein